MGLFNDQKDIIWDNDNVFVVPSSRSQVYTKLTSLLSENDYFGNNVPSYESTREGVRAFWKLVNKNAEWYALILAYVSLVSNQTMFWMIGSSFLDAAAYMFGKRRIKYSTRSIESDVKFRSRIERSRHACFDFVESLLSLVFETETVKDCVVVENATNEIVTKSGVDLDAHSIYLAVDGDDSDDENLAVATALWKAKSSGCGMTTQKPDLDSPLTYKGESLTEITDGATTNQIVLYNRSTIFTPSQNDVVLYVTNVNTVNKGILYKWDGTKWVTYGDSNVRRVRFNGDGGMTFSAVVNRVSKKKFYVRAFVRKGSYDGTEEEIKSAVTDAVVAWQENEVDTVDGLGIGKDAIRYECGNAISHTIPKIQIVDVVFYTKEIDLYGSYALKCDYQTAFGYTWVGGVRQEVQQQTKIDQALKYNSSEQKFYIDYTSQIVTTATTVPLTFKNVVSDYVDTKVAYYTANVLAYTIPGATPLTPPSGVYFMIYRGVEHGDNGVYYYGYTTLQAAFDDAKNGEHIYMVDDYETTDTATLSVNKEIWLDIAGTPDDPEENTMVAHTYTFTRPNKESEFAIKVSNGTLHVIDSSNSTVDTTKGFICATNSYAQKNDSSFFCAQDTGHIVFDGVSIKKGSGNGLVNGIESRNGGEIVFNYGNVNWNNGHCIFGHTGNGSIKINGGTLNSPNSNAVCGVGYTGTININGGIITSTTYSTIVNNGNITINSGYITASSSKPVISTATIIEINGGYVQGYSIAKYFDLKGTGRVWGTNRIYDGGWNGVSQGRIYSGWYAKGSTRSSSGTAGSAVSGSQSWNSTKSYYCVEGASWVDDADCMGQQTRVDVGPGLDTKPYVDPNPKDVYSDIDVYVYVKDALTGQKKETMTNDGVDIEFYEGEKRVNYTVQTSGSESPGTVQNMLSPTGEKRWCEESDVISVTGTECAYCSSKDSETGVMDTSAIQAYINETDGKFVSDVTFLTPSIDTYYVPSSRTKISLVMSFPSDSTVSSGQLICGFSGLPNVVDNTLRYELYVSTVSNGNATFKWAIGLAEATVSNQPLMTNGQPTVFTFTLTSSKLSVARNGGTPVEATITPSATHNYDVNSIRFMKESNISDQTTCKVTVKEFDIYEVVGLGQENIRLNLRPFLTTTNSVCLKDTRTGMEFGL